MVPTEVGHAFPFLIPSFATLWPSAVEEQLYTSLYSQSEIQHPGGRSTGRTTYLANAGTSRDTTTWPVQVLKVARMYHLHTQPHRWLQVASLTVQGVYPTSPSEPFVS